MLPSHRLQVEQSELREKINGFLGRDDLEDGDRAELGNITKRAQQLEIELRAALVIEGADSETRTNADSSEGREIRSLLENVSIADYLTPAVAGIGLEGRSRELNEALKVPIVGGSGGIPIPWVALETRAFTTTTNLDGGVGQRPILQRLFGVGILDALGVRLDAVPAGKSEWPLITAGTSVGQKAEGTAADAAVAATFTTEVLKPKRLTGRFEYTHEQAAEVADLEAALRRDLGDAVKAEMSDLAITGDENTNTHEPDGFYRKLTQPDVPSEVATYADYAGSHAGAVDGIHATMETEVGSVVGVASYQHAATVYQSGSGESGSEALKRRSALCMASPYITAPADSGSRENVQDCIFHAAGPNGGGADMRGDSVAAVWPTLEVIRDIYSQASQGVVLTWVALWDLEAAFRSAAYKRIAFKVA